MKSDTRGSRCLAVLTAVLVCLAVQAVFTLPAYGYEIVGWGSNYDGQGYIYYGQATPPAGNDFIAVAAGFYHSLALKSDGSIVGWGWNYYGQVTPPAGNNFIAVAAGAMHSLALKSDGSIVGWGGNYYGQATPPAGNGFIAVAAGGEHSLALKSDGSIVGWGYNYYGEATPPAGNDFIAIAAGAGHSLALKSDGSIVGWGAGKIGQSGEPYYGQATPPDGNDFIAVAAGMYHSLALKSDGSIVGWGAGTVGMTELPHYGQATPPAGNDFIAIAAGGEYSLALRNNPPFASAGADQMIYAGIDGKAKVILDGSDSNDADGDELTYKWTWTIDANMYEANGVNPTIELPVGVHTIQLMVNDGYADSAPDDMNVTVVTPLEGKLQVIPSTINRRSHQPHIQAIIQMPDGFAMRDIDSSKPLILYPGEIKATKQSFAAGNGISADFNKDALMAAVPTNGKTELKVAGKLKSGRYFYGDDKVMIISPPDKWR